MTFCLMFARRLVVPQLDSTAFFSFAGENISSIGVETWEFSTSGGDPPLLSSLLPAHMSATTSPDSTSISFVLNELVRPGTGVATLTNLTDGTFIDVDISASSATANVSLSEFSVFLNFPVPLGVGSTFRVSVPAGFVANAVLQPFGGISAASWQFATTGL